ncbi:hypothetical protein FRC12_024196 [Ceratobasidium sp. 428]|nr:hypothetical protein FRC12_024196 [Ceratobasidium sp. 428]
MGSEEVQQAFEQTIKEGHWPQALLAYNYSDKPIHPNNVSTELTGTIVLAFCTLQRLKFSKDKGARTEFQVHANLLKIQVLKPLLPPKPITIKLKFVPSYSPNDNFGPDGWLDSSGKKLKLMLVAE